MPSEPAPKRAQRVALVTGAGRGIGRGCALALAPACSEVVLVSRTRRDLDDTAAEIGRRGGRGVVAVCDVTDRQAVTGLIDALARVDVLVHAAGTNHPEPFLDVTEDRLDALLALNVKSAFFVSQAVARKMAAAAEGGAIIFITSQMGHVGAANRTVYCATKHAVEGLTRAMAVELAPLGIRVNAVAPTFVETSLTGAFLAEEGFRTEVIKSIPLRRIGRVEDIAPAVAFLASPAASLITGTSLIVDGGWTAQ